MVTIDAAADLQLLHGVEPPLHHGTRTMAPLWWVLRQLPLELGATLGTLWRDKAWLLSSPLPLALFIFTTSGFADVVGLFFCIATTEEQKIVIITLRLRFRLHHTTTRRLLSLRLEKSRILLTRQPASRWFIFQKITFLAMSCFVNLWPKRALSVRPCDYGGWWDQTFDTSSCANRISSGIFLTELR